LQAAWELDLFGANRRAREAAEARFTARTIDWHQARVSLAAEVASAYVSLRINEALLAGYERDAASRGETSRLTGLKTDAGFEAPANAALASAGASEAKARLSTQRGQVDFDVKALVALTGLAETVLRRMLETGAQALPSPAVFSVGTIPALVLAQRPDIAAAERELAALSAEIGGAEADRYPRISLTGSVGYSVTRMAGMSTEGATWGFGPSLTVPLFDAGRRAANVDLAKARYAESLAAYKATAIRAVREVEEALTQLRTAQNRLPDLTAAHAGYVAFEKAAQARLAAGAGSVLELEDARRAVLAAQVAVLALERERANAWISLYRAVGGGWDASQANAQTQVSENQK
jgi:NodT family efflux transporter outer membrane factor (OMF) lipoprotein